MSDPRTYTARELSGTGVWPPTLVVRRDNPSGPTGKVYAIYGDDDLTATRVRVAWGDAADINPTYLGDRGRDEDVADLIPAAAPPVLRWTDDVDEIGEPAEVFDAVVVEYAASVHGEHDITPEAAARLWRVDRARPWLLGERNTRGGNWVSSHISLHEALRHHQTQAYAEDWEIVEAIHHPTGVRLAGNGHELNIPSTITRDPVVGHVWVGGDQIVAHTGVDFDGRSVCLGTYPSRDDAHHALIFHALDRYARAHRVATYPDR